MDDAEGVERDHVFLVGGDDNDLHGRVVGGNLALEAALAILLLVEDDAEGLQAGEDHTAHLLAVLPHARGEHDGVDAAHNGNVGADVFFHGIRVHVVSELRALVASLGSVAHAAQVVAHARNAEQARLLVHDVVDLGGRKILVLHEKRHDGGIDRAAARAHHKAVERC